MAAERKEKTNTYIHICAVPRRGTGRRTARAPVRARAPHARPRMRSGATRRSGRAPAARMVYARPARGATRALARRMSRAA